MVNNLSNVDRLLRVLIGLMLIWAVLYIPMMVALLWILTFVGIILIATGVAGFCPLYSVLKVSTAKK